MPSPADRSRSRLAAHGLLGVLIVAAAIPSYLALTPAWRPLAVRLACAVVLIAGCMRLVGGVRGAISAGARSVIDAPPPAPRGPALDERFLRLRDDLLFSRGSRHYFKVFLWPRLRRLGLTDPPAPAEGRGRRRRGPSLATLDRLITGIEKRP